jgi:translation initiation factor 3 subunit I
MRPFHVRGTDRAVLVVKTNYDGDLFFQGSQDSYINCWVTETGERLGNYKTSGAVKSLAITVDSSYLVSASLEGSLDIFRVQGGVPVGRIRTTRRKARHIEFSFGDEYILIVI